VSGLCSGLVCYFEAVCSSSFGLLLLGLNKYIIVMNYSEVGRFD